MNNIKEIIRQASIAIADRNKERNIIAFISANDSISKQSILINMGLMFARADQKVIVVDTDFGNKSIQRTFNVSSGQGLAKFLEGDSKSLKNLIHNVPTQNLDIIVAGSAAADNKYLVDDPRFNMLMGKLATEYDKILISVAPISKTPVSSNILNVSSDAILIDNLKLTHKRTVYQLIKNLNKKNVDIIGYINVN